MIQEKLGLAKETILDTCERAIKLYTLTEGENSTGGNQVRVRLGEYYAGQGKHEAAR